MLFMSNSTINYLSKNGFLDNNIYVDNNTNFNPSNVSSMRIDGRSIGLTSNENIFTNYLSNDRLSNIGTSQNNPPENSNQESTAVPETGRDLSEQNKDDNKYPEYDYSEYQKRNIELKLKGEGEEEYTLEITEIASEYYYPEGIPMKDSKGEIIRSYFFGFDTTDENTLKKINLLRDTITSQFEYVIPWYNKLGNAYLFSQSVGNKMPAGPEWVGSPPITNDLPLIRFDHIASPKHHHYVLDRYGNYAFKYGGVIRIQQKAEDENIVEKTDIGRGDLMSVTLSKDLLSKLDINLTEGERILVDSDNQLYIMRENPHFDEWSRIYNNKEEIIEVPKGKDPRREDYWAEQLGLKKCGNRWLMECPTTGITSIGQVKSEMRQG